MDLAYERQAVPLQALCLRIYPGDNCGVAIASVEMGALVALSDGRHVRMPHTILEGHRVAMQDIAVGEPVLSWGLPFGTVIARIREGQYLCNSLMLESLAKWHVKDLPSEPNFSNNYQSMEQEQLVEQARVVPQVRRIHTEHCFNGYARLGSRGVGTRNYVIVVGSTSRTKELAKSIEMECKSMYDGVDGVVSVSHCEAGGTEVPNNMDLVVRTLAGFLVHPNVGAAIVLSYTGDIVQGTDLTAYLAEHAPDRLKASRVVCCSLSGDHVADRERCIKEVDEAVHYASKAVRKPHPVSSLRLALQCGGSDAFSGVSGNPVVGHVAKMLIQFGGSALLAETDELMGAESYILSKVASKDVARSFLKTIARFKEWMSWHDSTPEGNPSGGNNLRGLYNIALKSLGAARKKHPDVRLDGTVEYGEFFSYAERGYFFMDSPGNDLESIAGQVASGCNSIAFITGNGSVTNFPFVPTVKVMTTTRRFQHLQHDMDFNAGRFQDGETMDNLSNELFGLLCQICSGTLSKGEVAGHSQVSLWRNWMQIDNTQSCKDKHDRPVQGKPGVVPLLNQVGLPLHLQDRSFDLYKTSCGSALERIGLILPTSICSGEVARSIVSHLNESRVKLCLDSVFDRFVTLPHSEGCGSTNGESLYVRTLVGHLLHPCVVYGVFLEHGCEKTHNKVFERELGHHVSAKLPPLGWASIQGDGGMKAVSERVQGLFLEQKQARQYHPCRSIAFEKMSEQYIGVLCSATVGQNELQDWISLIHFIVSSDGVVLLPSQSGLLCNGRFLDAVFEGVPNVEPSVAFGEQPHVPGLHIMDCPTTDSTEILTGLCASGCWMTMVQDSFRGQHAFMPTLAFPFDSKLSYGSGFQVPRGRTGVSS